MEYAVNDTEVPGCNCIGAYLVLPVCKVYGTVKDAEFTETAVPSPTAIWGVGASPVTLNNAGLKVKSDVAPVIPVN